jgi:hypothetical protein
MKEYGAQTLPTSRPMTDDRQRKIERSIPLYTLCRMSSVLCPSSSARINLREDFVHDSSRKADFPIGNRRRAIQANAVVKTFDQFFHSEILIKPSAGKIHDVPFPILEMFPGTP